MTSIIVVGLVLFFGFWLIAQYVPSPFKIPLLVIMGVITLVWVLNLTGLARGLHA